MTCHLQIGENFPASKPVADPRAAPKNGSVHCTPSPPPALCFSQGMERKHEQTEDWVSKDLLTKSFNFSKFWKVAGGERFPLRIKGPWNDEFLSPSSAFMPASVTSGSWFQGTKRIILHWADWKISFLFPEESLGLQSLVSFHRQTEKWNILETFTKTGYTFSNVIEKTPLAIYFFGMEF